MSGRGGRRGWDDGGRNSESRGSGGGYSGRRDNRDRDRGDRRRRDRYEGHGRYRDGDDHNARHKNNNNEAFNGETNKKPIVLAKSERALEREKMEKEFPALVKPEPKKETGGVGEVDDEGVNTGHQQQGGNVGPGLIMVKQRQQTSASDVGVSSPSQPRPVSKKEDKSVPKQKFAVKLIDENHSFCEGISEYLTDNQDFLVVGVLGLQNTGKSTILNILAKNSVEDEEMFRVQSFEHQMLAEHCTNGIDVYVNSRRHIFLDCQPLLSASVLDRCVQLEKKTSPEFSSSENTVEIQSLQLIGFMLSMCHVVILVQDWFLDFGLMRLIQTAETLKPVTPTTSSQDNQVIEYFASIVLVHNKCEVADFEDDTLDEIKESYNLVWSKSRLKWKVEGGDEANLVLLPDHEGERADTLSYRLRPRYDVEKAGRQLRYKVLNMPRRNLTQTRLSEKGWVSLASRTWDNIKNSAFYMEYSRLLP